MSEENHRICYYIMLLAGCFLRTFLVLIFIQCCMFDNDWRTMLFRIQRHMHAFLMQYVVTVLVCSLYISSAWTLFIVQQMSCLFGASAFHNSWSRVFHPRMMVLRFPVLRFPPLHFWWSRVFRSRVFSRPRLTMIVALRGYTVVIKFQNCAIEISVFRL